MIERWTKAGEAKSVGLLGNAAEILPEMVRRGIRPDMVTDQTSAHDPLNGYLPKGWTVAEWRAKRESDPKAVEKAARASMREHVEAMVAFWNAGVPTLDYGNNIRQVAKDEGLENAFAFPGFVPAYIRPLFCRGIGPFRWAALSGDPEDIYKTDAKVKELTPGNTHLHNWLDMARERIAFQGLPARICWVGLGDRHRLGLAFNEMVAKRRTQGAGRHRPRPSRFRLGRLAEPRDGSDEGRLGRRLRLAAAQRAAQHRLGRHLGVAASWRRRRHGLLAAFRHGHLRRRHRRCRHAAWSACCGTTRRPASCAMPMPATTSPSTAPGSTSSTCRAFWAERRCASCAPPTTASCRGRTAAATTTEIAVSPDGAGLDDFDWRVSMARVESSGPFSQLCRHRPHAVRCWKARGSCSILPASPPARLTPASAPLSFPADVPTSAALIDGPITDLNVMTRRGRVTHTVERCDVAVRRNRSTEAGTTLILCRTGDAVGPGAEPIRLGPLDTLLLGPNGPRLRFEPAGHDAVRDPASRRCRRQRLTPVSKHDRAAGEI